MMWLALKMFDARGFGVRFVSLSLLSWSADFLFGLGCLDKAS